MDTTNHIIVDGDLKIEAERLFSDLGMNLETAVNLFLSQSLKENRLPIEISEYVPNEETLSAIQEVEEMKKNPHNYKGYTSAEDMMAELLK